LLTRRLLCLCLCCLFFAAAQQQPFAGQLLSAPDDASVSALLDANPTLITPDLFEVCRKAGQLHIDHRENAAALSAFKVAVAIAKHLSSDRSVAVASRGLGMSYRRLDQLSSALSTYQEGLAAAVRTGDPALQADLLRGVGVASRALGDFKQALDADQRSLAFYRDLHDQRQTAQALVNLAGNYRRLGDLRRAGELWEEAVSTGKDYPDVVSVALSDLAILAADLGHHAVARAYLERTNQFAEKQQDWHSLALGSINLGLMYQGEALYDKALASFNRGISLAIQTNDVMLQSGGLINRAILYVAMNRRAAAIADFTESIRLNQNRDAKEFKSIALSNLAWLEVKDRRIDDALEHAQQSVDLADQFQTSEVEWQAYDALGKCWFEKHESAKAKASLEKSIAAVEDFRTRSEGGEAAGFSLLESRIAPYHDLLRLYLAQHQPEEALSLAERAKARQLLDVMRLGKAQAAA